MKDVIKGALYQHYKGKLYKVLDIVKHSETCESMVLYEAQYENELGKLWVRPIKMFCEKITIDGKLLDRFKLIESSVP